MIGIFRGDESIYDEPIAKVLTGMETYGPEDPEFDTLMKHLEGLTKMKTETRRRSVTPDTMATVLGNLGICLIIIAYEQKHVIRTSVKDFFIRAK